MQRIQPESTQDIVDTVRSHAEARRPLAIEGSGSKSGLGRPVDAEALLSVRGLSGITSYQPDELVLTAWSGTPMREIWDALAEKRQHLAFEPAASALYGSGNEAGTLGGVLASNLSGPRRPSAGAARDHFLGFTAVNGLGEEFKAGGKVVKNVTGYDLPKLLAGSMGTLAVLLEVTVKVLPAPEKQRTVIVPVPDVATGHRCLTAQLRRGVRDRRRRVPAGRGRRALERRSGARAGQRAGGHAPDGIAGLGRRSLRRSARRHQRCRAKSCTACARRPCGRRSTRLRRCCRRRLVRSGACPFRRPRARRSRRRWGRARTG